MAEKSKAKKAPRKRDPSKRTKWTPERQERFLKALAETGGMVSKALRAVGMSKSRLYELREEDPEFAKKWDEAKEAGLDLLEDEVIRRALHGTLRPVFQGGRQVGQIREYSDTLLIFFLKANRVKYRERRELTGADGSPLVPKDDVVIVIPDNGRDGPDPEGESA